MNAQDWGVEPPALVEVWRRRGFDVGIDEHRIAAPVGPSREPVYPDLTKLAAELWVRWA